MEEKATLRRAIKERLQRMTENDRRVESNIILRRLRTHINKDHTVIALYAPYLDEPDLRSLITEHLEQKNVICLPKVDGLAMKMHRMMSLEEIGRNPVTNIIEPLVDRPVDEASITLTIVPARAFTKDGARLGRGNGGYDRWISLQRRRNPQTRFIGVCFDCQLVQEIPMEAHDEKVDLVITPNGKADIASVV